MRQVAIPRIAQIVGGGISGASTAASLARFGWRVRISAAPARARHPIALNGPARFILERIWGPDLLAGLPHHRLARRVIIWDRTARQIEDATIVVDAPALAQRMATQAAATGVSLDETFHVEPASWTVIATGRGAAGGEILSGGTRVAVTAPVALAATADSDALLIEAGPKGWVACVPTNSTDGVLFASAPATTATPEEAFDGLVAGTRAVRQAIAAVTGPCAVLEAAPRLRYPPHNGATTVFVGDAAIAFDPVSGDGAGVALRTAHLAASLAEAFVRGTKLEALHSFYSYRLTRAMSVHIHGLLSLYAEPAFDLSWSSELAAMRCMGESIQAMPNPEKVPSFMISEAGLGSFSNQLRVGRP